MVDGTRGRRGRRATAVIGVVAVATVWWWGGPVLRALVPMARPEWVGLEPDVRAQIEGQLRLAVVQATAALGGAVALLFTARTFRLNRRGQVTDRFIKALERLGSEEMYVRLGGVLALEQIILDAPDQVEHAVQVLNSFIRDRAPSARTDRDPFLGADRLPETPDADVQQALVTLTDPGTRHRLGHVGYLDLSGLHLAGASFNGADLHRVRLDKTNLARAWMQGADFVHATLSEADLTGAHANGAEFFGANLAKANAAGADLRFADLTVANLTAANLTGADLGTAMAIETKFTGATLVDAKLGFARLRLADFTGATLRGADLDNAMLGGAQLRTAVDLTAEQILVAVPTPTTELPSRFEKDLRVVAHIREAFDPDDLAGHHDPAPRTLVRPPWWRVGKRRERGALWLLEARPWAVPAARRRVVDQLREWGYALEDDTVPDIAALLVGAAVTGGRGRITLRMTDQDQQVLLGMTSHLAGPAVAEETPVLARIAALGVVSCGTDTGPDGQRLWAVIAL